MCNNEDPSQPKINKYNYFLKEMIAAIVMTNLKMKNKMSGKIENVGIGTVPDAKERETSRDRKYTEHQIL